MGKNAISIPVAKPINAMTTDLYPVVQRRVQECMNLLNFYTASNTADMPADIAMPGDRSRTGRSRSGKGRISAKGRRNIAQAQKERWANAQKKGATKAAGKDRSHKARPKTQHAGAV